MRFLTVSAAGFGAIRNASIRFAPTFTLVYGPNEAGKTTWHAALYAAFCGMRRGESPSNTDEDFIRRYRPWDFPELWEVSTVLLLEDGRRIELQQDLLHRSQSRATDVDLGRDHSNEIINEDCLDGSVWLGLDRRSFLATAFIRQTQLLEVLSNPDVLRTHLQRAAATLAVNSAGANALQLIENVRAEYLGEDRPNSKRPLHGAIARVDAMKRSLTLAKAEHDHYLELITAENARRSTLDKLRREWNLARTIVADRDANEWEARLQRVQQILVTYPERPTGDLDELNGSVRQVSTALRKCQERPAIPDLSGATADEIQAELQRLPPWPDGELEPDAQVLKAEAEFLAIKYALVIHTRAEPPQPRFPETAGLSSEQLRQLCSVLEEPEMEVDSRLEEVSRSEPVSERLIQQVHTAIDVWERRPTATAVAGPAVAEIRRAIEVLRILDEGDLEPDREVLDAANAYASAKEALRQYDLNRQPDEVFPDFHGISPAELRTVAQGLREPEVMCVSVLWTAVRQRSALREELNQLARSRDLWIGIACGLGLIALVLGAFFLQTDRLMLIGGILIGAVAVVALVSKWKNTLILAKQRELENVQVETPATLQRTIIDRIERFKLPGNPTALEVLADEFEAAQDTDQMCNLWKNAEKRLERAALAAADRLQSLLHGKMDRRIHDLDIALDQYRQECAERSRIAALASCRRDLEEQLAAAIEAEASAAEISRRENVAVTELRKVAELCEVTAESDADLVQRLQEWLSECDGLKALQLQLFQDIFALAAWKQHQGEARRQLQERALPADAAALRGLADGLEQAHTMKAAHESWRDAWSKLTQECELRANQLSGLLANKGLGKISEYLEDVLRRYREDCAERAQIAAKARRREDLERQLVARKQIEGAAARIDEQRQNAQQGLLAAAERCGVPSDQEEQLPENLVKWLNVTSKAIRRQQEALEEWRELDTLLEGRTIQKFNAEAQQQRESALVLGSAFSSEELLAAMLNLPQYEANVAELASQVESAGQELANIQGQIHNYEVRPTSVSDAEEELRTAEEELAAIRLLDDTLETTHALLTQAQNRAYRDIAPFLAEFLRHWLPEVTLGRYMDARVDPETLQVHVSDRAGKWREATLLSYGTAEQIYLLLRLALAQYLTKPSEVCPLILDDITVQTDPTRKEKILETLKAVSKTRQVILFSQEERVYIWAKQNLSEPEARIIELAATIARPRRSHSKAVGS